MDTLSTDLLRIRRINALTRAANKAQSKEFKKLWRTKLKQLQELYK